MENSILLKCTCENEFQDKAYGKGIRVHNIGQKDKSKRFAYCTVCANNRQRNKNSTTTTVAMGKSFGMVYESTACGPRIGKSF